MRIYPVPLYVTVPATSSRNVASRPLQDARQIASILMDFPANTSLALLYRFFMQPVAPPNNTVLPSGGELTQIEVQPGNFTGESISKEIPFQYPINPTASVLVMYVTNNTAVSLNAAATAFLEAD